MKKILAVLSLVALMSCSFAPVTVTARETIPDISWCGLALSPQSQNGDYTPFDYEYYINGNLVDSGSATAYFTDWYEGFVFCFTPCVDFHDQIMAGYILCTEVWEFDSNVWDNHLETCGRPCDEGCWHMSGEWFLDSWSDIVPNSNGYPVQFSSGSYGGYSPSISEILLIYQYIAGINYDYHDIYIYPSIGCLISF